jgi:stringent starvation protein B
VTPNQTKQKHINELLETGTVMVFLDARAEGVLVPERFRNDPELKLNFDYAFRVPDFEVREDGLIATLSFSQTPYFCAIPMEAIWQVVSLKTKKNYIYPESFPMEMIKDVLEQARRGAPIPAPMIELLQKVSSQPRPSPQMLQNPPRPKGFKPKLAVVSAPEPEAETPSEESAETPKPILQPAEEASNPIEETQSEPPDDEPKPRRGGLKLIK